MSNELQIKLTGDITALVSALNKAKATIKSFESETEKESEKGNVGFKRKIGLIESLTNKAKALRTALSQATNEQQVERYNQELEQTSKELTRLNALGRQVTASLGSTAGGFSQVSRQGGSAVGVTQEFNRIIQDAPFGLIGIGNNLQQLASNFSVLKTQAGSTGKAVGMALTSIISPINLGLLAVSALTAAFTAYQMGSLDFIFGTEKAEESVDSLDDRLKEYIETLGAVETANLNASKAIATERIEVDALKGVIENENISREKRLLALTKLREMYPGYLQGLSDETILSQGLRDVYIEIADAITKRATALALEDELVKLAKERIELNSKLVKDEDNFMKIQQARLDAEKQVTREKELIAEGTVKGTKRLLEAQAEVEKINELFNTANDLVLETGNGINVNKEATKQLGQEYQNIYSELLNVNALTKDWENATDDVKTKLSSIFAENDMITQFEMIGKAISEGVITPEQGQLIKDNLAKALVLADNESLDAAIRESLKGSFERATSRFDDVEIKEIPIKLDFTPESGTQELGLIEQLQEQIKSITALRDVATDPTRVQMYTQQLQELQAQLGVFTGANDTIRESNRLVADSFGALGTAIAANLDISNNAVKGFVSTVLSNAPKLIQAIIAQAQASNKAADIANAGNVKQATGNAIVTATSAAKGLGPIGLAALPILIGGALALVSSAFGSSAGGSSGGGAVASSGAPPQIFTNKNTVTPPNQNSPNYNPGSDIDWDKAQGRLTVDVGFDSLQFGLDMYRERKQSGG